MASSSFFIPYQYVPQSPLSMTQTDIRLYHHVLYLEELEDYGLPPKSLVPIPCLPKQDLFQDAHGYSDQEGL
jgi:hypothetical protein